MFIRSATLVLLSLAPAAAFMPHANTGVSRAIPLQSSEAEIEQSSEMATVDPEVSEIKQEVLRYKPGAANTEFARRYGNLVGKQVKTVGESFAQFTKELGYTVNPLYKNMVTDLVGTTHLVVVNARFQRDAVWSLGILSALDLLLKNYPEPTVGKAIVSALFKSMDLDEAEIRAEAKMISDWASGKTMEEIESALDGEGDSPLAAIAKTVKGDEFWMYSRYFGIGLLSIMESAGIEMDKDEVYPVMENWMSKKLGRSHLTACADSDLFFRIKDKLDMMETMMKEIEIREKKRMAERLEDKAEQALKAAEKEVKMQEEIAAEAAKAREKAKVDA